MQELRKASKSIIAVSFIVFFILLLVTRSDPAYFPLALIPIILAAGLLGIKGGIAAPLIAMTLVSLTITKEQGLPWPSFYIPNLITAFIIYMLSGLLTGLWSTTKRRRKEVEQKMAGLYNIGLIITSDLELNETFRTISEQVNRLMSPAAFYIALYDEARAELRFEVLVEGGERLPKFTRKIEEGGFTAWMVQSKEPLFIGDAEKESLPAVPGQVGKPARSFLGFPLLVKDKVIGAISVQSFRPHAFSEDDKRILSMFANQAAIAIENAKLFEEEEHRIAQLATIGEVGRDMASILDLDELLHRVVELLVDVLGYYYANVLMVDEEAQEIELVASAGQTGRAFEGLRLRIGEQGITSWVAGSGEPLLVNDVDKEPLYRFVEEQADTKSELAVPIELKGKVIGVMDVQSAEVGTFNEADLSTLTTLSDQVAVAIENGRLYNETKERAESLSALYEIGKEINATLDLDRILGVICDEAMRATGVAIADVALVDLEQGIWELKAIRGFTRDWKKGKLNLDEGIHGRAARSGEPALIPDVSQAEDYVVGSPSVRSELAVPIELEGKVVGVVNVESTELSAFDEDDLHFVQALADEAAIAIKNAQLFEELEGWGSKLEERVEERTKELREAQERLIRAERLATIGQFGASVAHELRNPLGVINNSIYYLNMKLSDAHEKVKKHLNLMEREIARSNKIINDLLTFARGKKPTLHRTQINSVVQEALSSTPVPEEVEVATELGEDLPSVMADAGQMRQVFINMIVNASQAMPDGGRLVIESEVVSRGEPGKGPWVAVSFTDNGCGIPEENLGKLFEPLFTTKAKGIGLGLAVSEKIMEAHGGRIEVESEVGAGTTFTVKLPPAEVELWATEQAY